MKSVSIVLLAVLCLYPAGSRAMRNEAQRELRAATRDSITRLASSVRELGLGEGAFIIGSYLTDNQIEQIQGNLLADSYTGTIKFSSGDVIIVADQNTYLILAIYQHQKEARADDVKQMVGHLMTSFGEPTTMAHGRLIYWAFDRAGKINEKTYNESKAAGIIEILATVKFSSTLDLNPGMSNDNMEGTGTIYYIITSDRLLESYIIGAQSDDSPASIFRNTESKLD